MAQWTTAYINDLPDSAFLYVEPGGEKDGGGKTVPRSLRHFPVKGADGEVDLAHLRNALARIPQSNLPAAVKAACTAKARKMLDDASASEHAEPDDFEMEVFESGHYGERGDYTDDDVARMAADYDPAVHEAPITVDHTKGGPAWGWVRGLKVIGGRLVAVVRQMPEAFKDLVRAGRYKKRSVELYRQFGATGRPYLRAVTFLGAQPPEVKGLADVALAEADGDVVVLSFDEGASDMADKTFTKAEFDAAVADAVAKATKPLEAQVTQFKEEVTQAKADADKAKSEAEKSKTGDGDDDPKFAELTATVADQKKALDAERNARVKLQADMCRQEIVRLCEDLERSGKLTPAARKAGLVEFMLALPETDSVEFGEGDGAKKVSPRAWFREFLGGMPQVVPTGELTKGKGAAGIGKKPWPEIAAEFAEAAEHYEAQGITLEGYAKINYGVEPPK
jgi:hypothetical protein